MEMSILRIKVALYYLNLKRSTLIITATTIIKFKNLKLLFKLYNKLILKK